MGGAAVQTYALAAPVPLLRQPSSLEPRHDRRLRGAGVREIRGHDIQAEGCVRADRHVGLGVQRLYLRGREGHVECRKKGVNEEGNTVDEVIRKCAPSSVIGQEAIFESGRRRYSVVASEASMLWKVERVTLMHFVHLHATQTRARRFELVRSNPLLHAITDEQVMLLVDSLQEVKLQDGETILVQGELNEKLCIIESGRARAEEDGFAIGDYGPGALFGELALLRPAVNLATVIAKEPTTLLQLSRSALTRICGPLQHVLAMAAELVARERAREAFKAAAAKAKAEADAKAAAKAKPK